MANTYGLDDTVMQSLLRHLAYIRNLCAHHSRIWNRKLTVTIKLPRSKPPGLIRNFNATKKQERNLYNTLVMLIYLMDIINPSNKWKERLSHLVSKHGIDVYSMGFPVSYKELPIWRMQ
uniref:Abi-like protein n=1 Tax=Candidatus Kentrum sp. FW TaxID=2126338 RepID=A0A450T7S3_9GAMM|nr:MAG: Abi-like protein [Candidatus Kentron sp. FW]